MAELSPESKEIYDLLMAETKEAYEERFLAHKKKILDSVKSFVDDTNKRFKTVRESIESFNDTLGTEIGDARASIDPDDCDGEHDAYPARVNRKETASGSSPTNSTSSLHHHASAAAVTVPSTTSSTAPMSTPSGATSAPPDALSPEARRYYDFLVGGSAPPASASTDVSTNHWVPTELDAVRDAVDIGSTDLTAPTPTICLSECPSRGASHLEVELSSSATAASSTRCCFDPEPAAGISTPSYALDLLEKGASTSSLTGDQMVLKFAPITVDTNTTDLAVVVPINCSSECPSHKDVVSVSVLNSYATQTLANCSGCGIDKSPSLLADAYKVYEVPTATEIVPWPPPIWTRAKPPLICGRDLFQHAQQKRGKDFIVKDSQGTWNANWIELREARHPFERMKVVKLKPPWPSYSGLCLNLPTAATNSAIVKNMHCKGLADPVESVRATSRCSVIVYSSTLQEERRQVLLRMPWQSFRYHWEATYLMKPCSAILRGNTHYSEQMQWLFSHSLLQFQFCTAFVQSENFWKINLVALKSWFQCCCAQRKSIYSCEKFQWAIAWSLSCPFSQSIAWSFSCLPWENGLQPCSTQRMFSCITALTSCLLGASILASWVFILKGIYSISTHYFKVHLRDAIAVRLSSSSVVTCLQGKSIRELFSFSFVVELIKKGMVALEELQPWASWERPLLVTTVCYDPPPAKPPDKMQRSMMLEKLKPGLSLELHLLVLVVIRREAVLWQVYQSARCNTVLLVPWDPGLLVSANFHGLLPTCSFYQGTQLTCNFGHYLQVYICLYLDLDENQRFHSLLEQLLFGPDCSLDVMSGCLITEICLKHISTIHGAQFQDLITTGTLLGKMQLMRMTVLWQVERELIPDQIATEGATYLGCQLFECHITCWDITSTIDSMPAIKHDSGMFSLELEFLEVGSYFAVTMLLLSSRFSEDWVLSIPAASNIQCGSQLIPWVIANSRDGILIYSKRVLISWDPGGSVLVFSAATGVNWNSIQPPFLHFTWDPGGYMQNRLEGKPKFKEGGLSATSSLLGLARTWAAICWALACPKATEATRGSYYKYEGTDNNQFGLERTDGRPRPGGRG